MPHPISVQSMFLFSWWPRLVVQDYDIKNQGDSHLLSQKKKEKIGVNQRPTLGLSRICLHNSISSARESDQMPVAAVLLTLSCSPLTIASMDRFVQHDEAGQATKCFVLKSVFQVQVDNTQFRSHV